MLAPIRTQQLIPSESVMRVEIMHGPSILTSIPLMREIASTSPLIFPTSLLHIPSMNWCGVTNTNMVASFTAQFFANQNHKPKQTHIHHTINKWLIIQVKILRRSSNFVTCVFKVWVRNNIFAKLYTRKVFNIFLRNYMKCLRIGTHFWKESITKAQVGFTLFWLMTSESFSPLGNISSYTHILTSSEFHIKT